MMDNPKFRSALIGGGVFGVAAAVPLPSIGLLSVAYGALYVGGGVLAAYLYVKDQTAPMESRKDDGAQVGLMAGAVGGVVATIVGAIVWGLGFQPAAADIHGAVIYLVWMMTGIQLPSPFVMELVLNVILFGILAAIGGLVGIAIFPKKDGEPRNTTGPRRYYDT